MMKSMTCILLLATSARAWITVSTSRESTSGSSLASSRRSFLSTASAAALLLPAAASAGIDPGALSTFAVEGDASGSVGRLAQIEGLKNEGSKEVEYTKLDSGVSWAEYREGRGSESVEKGSRVAFEMTARGKSFATNNEPGGLKVFDSR